MNGLSQAAPKPIAGAGGRGRLTRLSLAALLVVSAFPPRNAAATTIVPPRDLGELARTSQGIVLAVAGPPASYSRGQFIFTTTRFEVEEWISCPVSPQPSILVDVPGGEVDGTGWLVPGMPRFEAGGRYLLFLDRRPDGTWILKVASWGILREETGPKGVRLLGPLPESRDMEVYERPDGLISEAPATYRLERLTTLLRRVVAGEAGWDGTFVQALPTESAAVPLVQAIPSGCKFMTGSSGPLRWKTFDSGGSVSITALSTGDPSISGGGFSEVQGAVATWMGIAGTRLNLSYGGPMAYTMTCTASQDIPAYGVNIVMFADPCSDIADLSGCSGVLAYGGPWYGGTHTFDSQTWTTIQSWFVVVNNGVGCLGSTNYTRMLAHEMGHGLGFSHVSDSNALMYAYCCNAVNSTDRTCAQYAYPGATTPACTSFSVSPSSASPTASAGSQLVTITGVPSGCTGAWTATGNGSWIGVSTGSGNGSGSATVSWTANASSSSRSGTATVAGSTFMVNQAAVTGGGPGTEAATFIPLPSPCRAVDTRSPSGYPISGGRMGAGETRSFAVPSSSCSIPSNALAYSLNATVVPAGPLSYLTMWPSGQTQPLVSTLNSPDGRIKANAAIVPAGTLGAVSAYVTDSTDLLLDVNGYFVPSGSGGGLAFYPVVPCRISDTRNPIGPYGGPRMQGGDTRTLSTWTVCSIPSTAQALSLNYTVVPQEPLGYLTTWPTGQAQPFVSTLNAPTGTVVANAAIVPTNASGQVSVYVTNTTDVIVDVNGYFAPAGSPGALSFYAATPCRISDTRLPVGAFGGPAMSGGETRGYSVPASACSIPSTAEAYSLNATVVPGGWLGYLTLWPSGISQPEVSTLNAPDGSLTSNAALVPAGTSGAISVFVSNPTNLILDVNGYFAP